MPGPEIRKRSPLIDAEKHLMRVHRIRQAVEPVMLRLAPLKPAERPLHRSFGVLIPCRIFHALVKSHGDIAAQIGLDLHGLLRPHEDAVSVNMAGKGDALLPDLPQGRQRKHLKSAGICQNRAVPVHELVEAAHLAHDLIAGTQVQMIGVGQFDLAAHRFQIQSRHAAFDGSLRPHVHEYRRLHRAAMGAGKFAPPGLPFFFQYLEHIHVPFPLL